MKTNKTVLPGECLCTSEEFVSGEGTFEEGNKIFASVVGAVERNSKTKTIKVIPCNKLCILKEGNLIVGSVIDLRDVFASIEILKVVNTDRGLAGESVAFLHISKVDKCFVDSIQKKYRIGDLVKAKVIQAKPIVELSTADKVLGVIKAYCTRCKAPLKLKLNRLFCSSCKRTELRKFSIDYGKSFT